MCSILAILELGPGEAQQARTEALALSARMRHRGPDWNGVAAGERAVLAHERLAIVDPESGEQPLLDGSRALAVNGEIYNHQELRTRTPAYAYATASDCEVILPLYRELGTDLLPLLSGIFAFVLHDEADGSWLVARDPIGVIPLYWGRDERGRPCFASELKALVDVCPRVEVFPPGHYLTHETPEPVRWYAPIWRAYGAVQGATTGPAELAVAFEAAVVRQLMSDVPYGALLSGGLDSSLVAAIAARHAARRIEDHEESAAWWPRLHTFSIGLEDSPDLAAAQQVADAIGSVHHPVVYTVEQGIDALSEVVRHVETFDVTTIRASTPMFLLARRVKAVGVKMVLSGEGADEIFGGYLYFHKAPNAREFHAETVRKLDELHRFDCLRANKSMAAWGVEARVPFLDLEFLEVAMGMDPEKKRVPPGGMEKHVLREAFEGWLPDKILWRQKEQFSDGVGYGWIDALQDLAEERVTDRDLAAAAHRFPVSPPTTKEAYFYRTLFEEHFPGEAAARTVPYGPSIACSSPAALAWDPAFAAAADPSGRAVQGVHLQASEKQG